jgi:adenosine deaminase
MKVDLHRHFGGCISPALVCELLPEDKKKSLKEVKKLMVCDPVGPKSFQEFLRKFDILNDIVWDEDAVKRSIHQVYWDIVGEKIDYAELHFTVGKYVDDGWDPLRLIRFMRNEFDALEDAWSNKIGLVLSLKYESTREEQEMVAYLIDDMSDCVVGLDLVGDESYFNADFYKPIFNKWRSAGKGLEAHVGESQGIENVRDAIKILEVDRIAHGIKIIEDKSLMQEASERAICFDVALSSNVFTGIVNSVDEHPISKMIENNLIVTLGTDDPVQYSNSLDIEYNILSKAFKYKDEVLHRLMNNSVEHAFTDL